MSDPVGTKAEQITRREPSLWRQPAFLIIVIAGLFHLGRGATVDGVVFLGLAAGLLLTKKWELAGGSPPATGPSMLGVTITVLFCLLYGWVLGHWIPYSLPVKLLVALPGLAVMPLAWRVLRSPSARSLPSGRWLWAITGVLICLWELTSFLFQPDAQTGSYAHPTLSVILDPLFTSATWRTLLFAAWLAAGVALARMLRGHRG